MKKQNFSNWQLNANLTAIANALGINIPFPSNLEVNPVINPLSLLTPELSDLLTDEQAFLNAFRGDIPLLKFRNGMIEFDGSEVLFSYLLARLFTDDYTMQTNNETIWKSGTQNFPQAALNKVFKMNGTRNLRQNKLNSRPPQGYERVDNLFDKKKKMSH